MKYKCYICGDNENLGVIYIERIKKCICICGSCQDDIYWGQEGWNTGYIDENSNVIWDRNLGKDEKEIKQ